MSGQKFDQGKIRYDLIPPEALRALASQLTYGAEKYEDRDWEKGIHFGRLVRAATGHLWDWWAGEEFDEEGRPHLHGAITSLAMLLSLVERHTGFEFDDRPVKPNRGSPNMEAQMQRTVTYLRENPAEIVEFTAMLKAAFPESVPPTESNSDWVVIPHFDILPESPVESVENSAETDQSTGGNRVKYRHKVHYQTSVFGEIMCNTRNTRKMSDRANDVTCNACLMMMH